MIPQPAGVVNCPASMGRPHVLKNVKEVSQLRKKKLQDKEVCRNDKIGDGAVVSPSKIRKVITDEAVNVKNTVVDKLIREIMNKE